MTFLTDQLSSAWPRRSPPSFIWLVSILIAALMAIPLIYLLIRAGQADADAWGNLTSSNTQRLLKNTVLLALAVTGGSATLALPMAWLTTRTDLPLRRLWAVVTVLPLVVPSYVGALAFVAALGQRGTLQQALAPLGVDSLPDLRGFEGAWLALMVFTYPYLLLVLRAGLRGMDPAMEEASRALGLGPWRTFWRVVVPQLRVPLAAGSLLVALYVLSDFGAVSILRFDTFTGAIYGEYQGSFDRAAGAVLSLTLVALVVVVLGLEASTRARGRHHSIGATQRRSRVVRLGRWRWPSLLFLTLVALLSLGLPLAVLSEWLTRGSDGGDAFRGTWTAAWHSLSVSAVAGLVALTASNPGRHPGRAAPLDRGLDHRARQLLRFRLAGHRRRAGAGLLLAARHPGPLPDLVRPGLRLRRPLPAHLDRRRSQRAGANQAEPGGGGPRAGALAGLGHRDDHTPAGRTGIGRGVRIGLPHHDEGATGDLALGAD